MEAGSATLSIAERNANWLRSMYRGGRADARARRFARFWSRIFGWGLAPRRWVSLEVPGCRTGKLVRVPLGMARVGDSWFLGSMLGECNWVRNVRSAGGDAVLRHGRARAVHLTELPAAERPAILKAYLTQVPGARPHNPVGWQRPVAEFEAIAADFPVFRVGDRSSPRSLPAQ